MREAVLILIVALVVLYLGTRTDTGQQVYNWFEGLGLFNLKHAVTG